MSEYIHKSHNVTVLLYQVVFPAKYRKAVFDTSVDQVLKAVCLDIDEEVPDKVLRNRHGYRSCTFFGTIDSNLQRNKASKNDKKHYGPSNTKAIDV